MCPDAEFAGVNLQQHLLVEVSLQRFVGVVDQQLLQVVLVPEVLEPCVASLGARWELHVGGTVHIF